jgi:putative oxidoreductase
MATHVTPFDYRHRLAGPMHGFGANALRYVVPIGRALFALIFIVSAPNHFSSAGIDYAAQHGVPAAQFVVPVAGLIALVGGLSVALGFRARFGAWLLLVFLLPVTLWMHAFWNETDPMMMQMQMINFMKNVALMGGALYIAYFGAGPVSLDEYRKDGTTRPLEATRPYESTTR